MSFCCIRLGEGRGWLTRELVILAIRCSGFSGDIEWGNLTIATYQNNHCH